MHDHSDIPPHSSEAWRRALLEAAKRREIEEGVKVMRQRIARLARRVAPDIKSEETDEDFE